MFGKISFGFKFPCCHELGSLLIAMGNSQNVAGSDLGVEIFEDVTSPGTIEEGQPGNRVKIQRHHPLGIFGLLAKNSNSITLLEFWRL